MLIEFLKSKNRLDESVENIVNIRFFDMDLRETPDHEIFEFLEGSERVLEHFLDYGSRNSIKVKTDINLIKDMYIFSEEVLEPLRQMGYDVIPTHLG